MEETTGYKQDRLEEQIKWHSQKAHHNKQKFRLYQIIILIASAIIPTVNVVNFTDLPTRISSSIMAGIIAVATGITQLEKYQENWILYRTSTELLKKEKYFFENNAGEYSNLSDVEKNKLLVERVESIVSAETSRYFTMHQPHKQQQQQNEKSD
jgi:Protein of unknown function (DUF4231)